MPRRGTVSRVKIGTLALIAVAVLAAPAVAATQPVVPVSTQHRIATRAPLLAYVPARVASGYRYSRWALGGSALRIWFRNPAKKELVFVAAVRSRPCAEGREKTFQLAGNKVYWAQTAGGQQAWRCVAGANGRTVQLTAATTQPPTQFADVGLGRVAASGHRVR